VVIFLNLTDGVGHAWGDYGEFIIQLQIIFASSLIEVVGDLRIFPLITIHLKSCASAQQSKASGGGDVVSLTGHRCLILTSHRAQVSLFKMRYPKEENEPQMNADGH
jgi:hypothetical protein